jgi:hypothetical protein
VDWPTEAAAVALSRVCREGDLPAAARTKSSPLLRDLSRDLPDRGHCVYD